MSVTNQTRTRLNPQSLVHKGNRDFGIPIANIKPLIKVIVAQGISLESLLDSTNIARVDLSNPSKSVTLDQYLNLIINSRQLSKDPTYALKLGEQFFINHEGVLACRVMCCRNAREAMKLLIEYQALFTQVLSLDLDFTEDGAVFSINERIPLGEAFPHFVEYAQGALYSLGRFCLGRQQVSIDFSFQNSNQDSLASFSNFFNNKVTFDHATNQAFLPNDTLEMPCIFQDDEAALANDKLCKQHLEQINNDAAVIKRVKAAMRELPFNRITLDVIGEQLCMSPRSLRRHLQSQGSSFTALLENERKRIALSRIERGEIGLETLAEQLGYNSAASFSRAFKRWFGISPNQYKQERS